MANDNPDWTTRTATPALKMGTTTVVSAGATGTVFTGAVPAGIHAVKVYVESADPSFNASQIQFVNNATGHVMVTFNSVAGTEVIAQVDDICTPSIKVTVTAPATHSTTATVVAYLSDQAVWIDNDPSSPVPVRGNNGFPVIVQQGGSNQVSQATSGSNAAVSLTLVGIPGQFTVLDYVTASYTGATTTTANVQVIVGGTTIWEAVVEQAGVTTPPGHFTFPNGGMQVSGSLNTGCTVTLSASGAGGVAGILSIGGHSIPP